MLKEGRLKELGTRLSPEGVPETMSNMTISRLIGLIVKPGALMEIGSALPLLVSTIVECGDDDACTVNLHEMAEKFGVSHTSVKAWARRLEAQGYISKHTAGKCGLAIVLSATFPEMAVFETVNERIRQAEQLLQGMKLMVEKAVGGALVELKAG